MCLQGTQEVPVHPHPLHTNRDDIPLLPQTHQLQVAIGGEQVGAVDLGHPRVLDHHVYSGDGDHGHQRRVGGVPDGHQSVCVGHRGGHLNLHPRGNRSNQSLN